MPCLRWAVDPALSFKLVLTPIVAYVIWELLTQHLGSARPNPFGILFLISHKIPTSGPADPRYAKGWCDLLFIAYYVVVFSCFRQLVTVELGTRVAKLFGIRRRAKIARFGEQAYALVYFSLSGAYGYRIMSQLPTWWYKTEYFWIDYPHWDMKPGLKRYYLMQTAYWIQQVLVLMLGLERPRTDYHELVAHHIVTIWLIGGSYVTNQTRIGNAVFLSMDVPEVFFAFSKLLNYLQMDRAKVVSLAIFTYVWTYFRHYLNLVILWSVWTEVDRVPAHARRWAPAEGTYMVWWMKPVMFVPLAVLQLLNVFWYHLILRILIRAIATAQADDVRSDDEDEDGGEGEL
ncbi:longevity assurance proteins LAG1/LAC1 [Mycena pura]|uniref:Longevity assurance proteins LAG1/LAC1 n=1 Tax=Mycena pura TaxID=153505 RepID=A0AAD6VJ87_9AGAR|nr:longevity assurance proteins LAG1/LAC1 [Mycena pura]